jgi:hypothetical protein
VSKRSGEETKTYGVNDRQDNERLRQRETRWEREEEEAGPGWLVRGDRGAAITCLAGAKKMGQQNVRFCTELHVYSVSEESDRKRVLPQLARP